MTTNGQPSAHPATEALGDEIDQLEQKLRDAQQFRTLEEKVQDLKDQGRLRTGDETDDPQDDE